MVEAILLAWSLFALPSQSNPVAMTLEVDASDAPQKILHATATMPARPGAMTLFYPKWIPGEHMPSGPIANLTGLHVFADGKEVEWRRDLGEMHAFANNVPGRARPPTGEHAYDAPPGGAGRRGGVGSGGVGHGKDRAQQRHPRVSVPEGPRPRRDHGHRDAHGAGRLEARRIARRRSRGRPDDPLRADLARDAQRSSRAARRTLQEHHAVAGGIGGRRTRARPRRPHRVGAAIS